MKVYQNYTREEIQKKLDGLKQLDRIEFRQKNNEFYRIKDDNLNFCIMGYILSVVIGLLGIQAEKGFILIVSSGAVLFFVALIFLLDSKTDKRLNLLIMDLMRGKK